MIPRPTPSPRSGPGRAPASPSTGSGRRRSRVGGTLLVALLAALLAALGGCGDDPFTPSAGEGKEMGVVLNSIDLSLTLFPVDSPGVVRPPVGLAPDGSPVGFSVRGELAAVPLGFVPALAVVDLGEGRLLRTVSLPAGSGATGSAFLDDSLVLVANPNLDTVVPVNVLRGTVGEEIAVGGFPQGVVVSGARVLVLNSELGPDFLPSGPGTVTLLDRETLEVVGTITLGGTNPGAAVVAPDGLVHVVNSGSFGAGDGSLSVVDPRAGVLVEHHGGFGEFPFGAALGNGGLLHVGSFGYGVAVWDPASEAFVRPPSNAVTPDGVPGVSGLGFDGADRLHTLLPECAAPSRAHRLGADYSVSASWPVGTCPIALAFTELED